MVLRVLIWAAAFGLIGSLVLSIICIIGLWNERVNDFIANSIAFKIFTGVSLPPLITLAIVLIVMAIQLICI